MKNIFRLSREERLPALVALVVFVALNVLMTRYNPELFMRGGRVGFWSIFWGHFHVSGFDSFTYMTLSKWTVYYTQFRHPLLPFFWYPFAEANGWLMRETEVNYAIYFVAVAMVVFAFYSFVFLYRVFREVMELGRADACLLSSLFFSFAYIMLSVMVPDHFGISLFFLTMTLYVAGRRLKAGRAMPWWQTALLFVLTAGVTISNGAKVFLAALFANGKAFFRLRHLFLAVVVPAAVIGAVAVWQNEAFIKPHVAEGLRIQQANEQKNRKVAEQNKKYVDRIAEMQGEKVDKKGVLSWTDPARWWTTFSGSRCSCMKTICWRTFMSAAPCLCLIGGLSTTLWNYCSYCFSPQDCGPEGTPSFCGWWQLGLRWTCLSIWGLDSDSTKSTS